MNLKKLDKKIMNKKMEKRKYEQKIKSRTEVDKNLGLKLGEEIQKKQ